MRFAMSPAWAKFWCCRTHRGDEQAGAVEQLDTPETSSSRPHVVCRRQRYGLLGQFDGAVDGERACTPVIRAGRGPGVPADAAGEKSGVTPAV